MQRLLRTAVVPFLALVFCFQGVAAAAAAGSVTGTEAMLAGDAPAADARATVQAQLARDDVRAQMAAMGVDPDMAAERVAALSDAEVQKLAGNIESAPAGGDVLAVVGIVFVVLLILEAAGVTDIFKSI